MKKIKPLFKKRKIIKLELKEELSNIDVVGDFYFKNF
tara:strand:+ start:196 stop:306 length:111 start_codon:yes stop_codon:yes gene_type:complete